MTTKTSIEGNTLIVERTYAASQAEVFDAWIDAAKTKHWWGCGQTNRVASTIEAQTGGLYQHLMTIEGVGDYLIDGLLLEFDPPRLLSYKMPGPTEDEHMTVRVTFTPEGNQTRVTLTQSPLPDPMQAPVSAGWTASFERLADFFTGERRAA